MRIIDMHPLLVGLIEWLPPTGTKFSPEDREKWLSCSAAIFKLLYTEPQPAPSAAQLPVVRREEPQTIEDRGSDGTTSPAGADSSEDPQPLSPESSEFTFPLDADQITHAPDAPAIAAPDARSSETAPIPTIAETATVPLSLDKAAPGVERIEGEDTTVPPTPSSSPSLTLKEAVGAAMIAHPDWKSRQIAEATGKPLASVQTTMGVLRREWVARSPVEAEEPSEAPEYQPEPQPPLRPVPTAAIGVFYLKNDLGEFLHKHERGMTRLSQFYWTGSEADILDLKQRRADLCDLIEQVAA